jgi:DNA-binding NtrC family response regulator
MQIIIYRKTNADPDFPLVTDWKEEQLDEILNGAVQKGTVLVVKKSDFEKLFPFPEKILVMNCGIKKQKVELFRAFKLDQVNDRELPRRLIAGYLSPGAFKRSFFPFYESRYKATDPTCFLFIPDETADELARLAEQQSLKTEAHDPISLLLLYPPKGEISDKMKSVYIGESPDIRLTRAMIYKAAHSELPVLILGESGTGKELIARQIHNNSNKSKDNFHAINCSALPEPLLESELFGHVKGSFTDARQDKKGLFEVARDGTLLLDEIGDMSLLNQAKVLRALDEKKIKPVGANESIDVNVRIIAATNRNLASMMKQNTFRDDLFYRLNSLIVFAPPLREHTEDIPEIASAIWAKINSRVKLSDEFMNYLKEYTWPGNVRELKTMLHSIADLFGGVSPGPEHIEAIRNYHKKILRESNTGSEEDDYNKMLKAQSRNRILEIQNVLKDIKLEIHLINNKRSAEDEKEQLKKLKTYIGQEAYILGKLCSEPIFSKNLSLFGHFKKFHTILMDTLNHWPASTDNLLNIWQTDVDPLHENINRLIFDTLWGKMDF